MEQRTLTLRTAMRTARAAAGVRVHIVDREWAWALWRNGWEVSRPHFPAGELVAVGRRGATGELVLYVSRDLPHDSHVRAILETVGGYLPEDIAARCMPQARTWHAKNFMALAVKAFDDGALEAASRLTREASRLNPRWS